MEVLVLVIIVITVAAILGILLVYHTTRFRFERRFREWQEAEWLKWQVEQQGAVREAIAQSRAVLGGKFTEQMAPFLPQFRYDPTEARFIGSPVDMIVFPGLACGDPQEIVILEIKSGRNAQLSPQERKIRQLIENGMVRWELLQRTPEGEVDYP